MLNARVSGRRRTVRSVATRRRLAIRLRPTGSPSAVRPEVVRGSTELPGPGAHRRPARVQPLADPAGGPRRPPVHRPGLRDQRLQGRAGQALRHQPDRDRHHLLDRHRDARPVGGRVRHLGRPQRPARRDVHRRLLLVGRLPGRLARHLHRPAVAGLPRLRRHRRHRPGHRLHLAGLHADQVVPRPPGPGHRHGDHGLRRRRADRLAAVAPADGPLRPRLQPGGQGLGAGRQRRRAAVPHPGPGLPRLHAVRRVHRAGAGRRLEARGLRPVAR